MSKRKDITVGDRFGRLVVLSQAETAKTGHLKWLCRCDCGREVIVYGTTLFKGAVRSCGCLQKEKIKTIRKEQLFDGTDISRLNSNPPKNSTSGVRGVYRRTGTNKWRAAIKLRNKRYFLGSFDSFQDAVNARKRAEEELWGPVKEEYVESLKQEEEK